MLEETINNLKLLELNNIANSLSSLLDKYNKNNISVLEILNELTKLELKTKEEVRKEKNIIVSHFPFRKTIEDFDFNFQPSVNKQLILDLKTLRFIEEYKNIIFLGNSGVGKTHLATAIGIEASSKRYSVYFITCNDLINNLLKAYKENKADERIKHYNKYKLLIIDEVGYLPIDKTGSNLLFQLLASRYEKKSTIITTNQKFSNWPDLFGDTLVANAMLDRLVHHSIILNINGNSYRMKEINEKLQEGKI